MEDLLLGKIMKWFIVTLAIVSIGWGIINWDSKRAIELYMKGTQVVVKFVTKDIMSKFNKALNKH